MNNYRDIVNDLISEEKSSRLVTPYIEFIKFDPEEISKLKDKDIIEIIKPIKNFDKFNIGTYVKPEWGKVYKVEDKQYFQNFEDWPLLNTLTDEQIKDLAHSKDTMFISLKLVRVRKKDVVRYFYDFEFDESPEYGIKPISVGIVDEDGHELYLVNKEYDWNECKNDWLKEHVKPFVDQIPVYLYVTKKEMAKRILNFIKPNATKDIKLYGYYSDYDHVCLCQLFGKMTDLPKDMPQYTIDLIQYINYFGINIDDLKITNTDEHDALADAKWNKQVYNALKEKYGSKYL